jgi:type II secretory pathway pseudopilin PulG
VVIVILVTLVAVTLPMMRPALEGREMREAARQLNTFLGSAQARAMARGRPVGVMFHRQPDNLGASFQMSIAEVPPPYAGDSIYSRAYAVSSGGNYQAVLTGSPRALFQTSPGVMFVGPGDFIKFGYRGVRYRIEGVAASGEDVLVTFAHAYAPPPTLLPKFNTATGEPNPGLEFQIYRKPRRTAAAPLELPTPAVVDWTYSGFGAEGAGLIGLGTGANNNTMLSDQDAPIIITFSPSGRVDQVFANGVADTPLGTLYLLVGRVDQVGPPTSDDWISNLQDSKSLWVSVGQRTGLVNTAPNQGGPQITNVVDARQFALRAQSMGGR